MKQNLKWTIIYISIIAVGVLAGFQAPKIKKMFHKDYVTGNYDSYFPNQETKIILYSKSWCEFCKKTREFLNASGKKYVEYDIEKNAAALEQYNKLGGNGGVPMVIIGSRQINGYYPPAFTEAIQLISRPE
jgi:glutaredoxin